MFTGIVETMGEIRAITQDGNNVHFDIHSSLASELKVDQSVSHNGVCLTVVDFPEDETYRVTAIDETLQKSNLGNWAAGTRINLERCMRANGRLDGHIVQGHVDATGVLESVEDRNGSWLCRFSHARGPEFITVAKGSICINGASLTVIDRTPDSFSVAIIPYTWEHTNFHLLKPGNQVNLEFDIVGKYVATLLAQRGY